MEKISFSPLPEIAMYIQSPYVWHLDEKFHRYLNHLDGPKVDWKWAHRWQNMVLFEDYNDVLADSLGPLQNYVHYRINDQ